MAVNNGALRKTSDIPSLFDRFFNDSFPFKTTSSTTMRSPPMDVYEDGGDWIIEASVPGYGEDDLNVELKDNVLTIQAEKTDEFESEDGNKNWHRQEISHTSVQRSVRIPSDADYDPNEIEASLENGILSVCIPDVGSRRTKDVRKIDIQSTDG